MPDLSNFGQYGQICNEHPYGAHIVLTCKHHPDLRWSTKNIAPIGARNIFFTGKIMSDGKLDMYGAHECACSGGDLVHICDKVKE